MGTHPARWTIRHRFSPSEEAAIPTSVAGLMLLLVLALPGYVYHRALARHVPGRVYTAFQELVSILFASVVVDVVVVAALEAGSRLDLWFSPSFRALVGRPQAYATVHFDAVAVWGAVAMAIACALAYAAGAGRWSKSLPRTVRQRWDDRARRLEPQISSWWLLFREHPDAEVYVGCVLEDGTYLAGVLHSYSRVPMEHGDRELTLRGDILYRPPGETEASVLPQVNAVAVSARRLSFLTVSYLPRETAEPSPPLPPSSPDPIADPEPLPVPAQGDSS
ncbi:DUF6338 family protein [Streptomyces asoensis]|nr:DUF6338 family protein [Streptomyces asoensis]